MRLLLLFLFVCSVALGVQGEEKKTGLIVDELRYDDRIYSRSKKAEMGQEIRFETRLKYIFNENTSFYLGAKIDPEEDSADDETTKIEFRGKHKMNDFTFKADFDLSTTTGMQFGFDQDSENTFIDYQIGAGFYTTLYPFNFDGEVGKTFNTWDVTRIYEITGTPTTVDVNQTNGETLNDKTIPGVVIGYKNSLFEVYGGFGFTTFLYPASAAFDIDGSLTSNTWERREDIGYKAGFSIELSPLIWPVDLLAVEAEYVGHTKTVETGSLLQDAGSVYTYAQLLGFILIDAEFGISRAGKNAYRVNRSRNWFEILDGDELVYSDSAMADQDWLGKTDFAVSGRIGFKLSDKLVPYLLYRYQGPHYIFRERESAHRLRTGDDRYSHGGLHRMGLGSYFKAGKFIINPEFEAMIAKNAVFTNSADIQASRLNSSYRKNDFLLRLKVTYKFDQVTDIFRL